MTQTLLIPGMPTAPTPVTKTSGQWRMERLQLINWGGFEGHHTIELDRHGTLISGGSGTGKSTILDAHIALMMETNIAFNGASNDAGTGRARSMEQRNLLSYMRGQIDVEPGQEVGSSKQKLLRGERQATWSALAATFAHDDGSRHTALRMYHAAAVATASTQVFTQLAQVAGPFNLTQLEPYAADRFDRRRLRTAFPALEFFDNYTGWAGKLHSRLGIGRDGDGLPAMRMLARIQAGKSITSVDHLYKEMVLERPGTYEVADDAVEHFAKLVSSHNLMRTAQEQIAALSPAAELWTRLEAAQQELALLDTFHLARPQTQGPVTLWACQLHKDLLETESLTAKDASDTAREQLRQTRVRIAELNRLLATNLRSQRDNGGDALEALAADIATYTDAHTEALAARAVFAARTAGPAPDSAEDFAALQASARADIEAYAQLRTGLQSELTELLQREFPLSEQARLLRQEHEYLASRRNLIPQELDAARNAIAAQVGIDAAELPFVAELLDLQAEHEAWRPAAELLLGGLGRTLLVDRRHTTFRRDLDALRLGRRINFRLVPADQPVVELSPDVLPGRLQFDQDSPFRGWLSNELRTAFSYQCVQSPDLPEDNGRRIALSGQVQNGPRGAHGGHGTPPILGFSTAARLAEIAAEREGLQVRLSDLGERKREVEQRQREAETRQGVCGYLRELRWERLDDATPAGLLATVQDRHTQLLASSDVLADLQRQEVALQAELAAARTGAVRAEDTHREQSALWEQLVTAEDDTSREIERLLALGVDVSAAQQARLAAEYQTFSGTGTAAELDAVLIKMRGALTGHTARAREDVSGHSASLSRIFAAFQERWPQPDLGISPTSYPDYQQILDRLNAEGLAERRAEFTKRVIEWAGEDLLLLNGAYGEAFDEITRRLAPVNEVLATLPYGDNSDRLRIRMRQLKDADVVTFRAQLRALSESAVRVTADQVEARFAELQAFMAHIQPSAGIGSRDQLLDVRRHLRIDVERVCPNTGEVLSLVDSLANKSGGESQELIAFIVGAALRYRLGINDDGLPAYAPVVLDEAFIKADSEFAGRAVSAWQSLGFQLVIGAPLDKVSAIEPYVDTLISVTKHQGYSYTSHLAAQTPAGAA